MGLTALLASAPAWPVAVLVLAVWVGLTGALHLDGLADSADAWLGGYGDRARTLAIMKDPYCGPAGWWRWRWCCSPRRRRWRC